MSGGTNTTTSQNSPPPQFLNAYQNVLGQAAPVASTPYSPYPGQIVAGQSPDQQAGITAVQDAQGVANPYINSAAQHIDAATAPIWSGIQQFSPQAVQQYESPYTDDVVHATEAEFNNQNEQQQQGVIGNAISRGAWGGDRSAVAQGITAGQEALAQAPVIAGLKNQGYTQALNEFNTQQGSQLGATEAQRWLDSQAGAAMGGLGQEALSTSLTGANALLGTGGLEQTQAQAELNVPYQQFLAAQAYPFQTTGWLANIAEGLGGASGGTSSTTSPGPSVASQVGGGLVAGTGLIGATGGFGKNGWLSNAFSGSGGSSAGIDSGGWDVPSARGGAIPHRAPGGIVPNLDVSVIPGSTGLGDTPATHGTMDILKDYGQTATTTGGDSGIGSLLKTAGLIAAGIFGGPAGAAAGTAFNSAVHFDRGGGITLFPIHRARAPGTGIVSNDNWHPEPLRHRAMGGITSIPSAHGGPDIPQLGGPTGGIVPMIGPVAHGILSPSLSDYFAHQNAGRSFALPPSSPKLDFHDLTSDHSVIDPGAALKVDPMQPNLSGGQDSGGGSEGAGGSDSPGGADGGSGGDWRGGIVRRDEGGDIPDFSDGRPNPITSPEEYGIPTGGGPSIPRSAGAGIVEPGTLPPSTVAGHIPTERVGNYVPPPAAFVPLIVQASERHGVDPKQLAWLLSTESHWNPKAYNPQSGTKGLGQFKDATAHEVGIDPWDVAQAIDGSAKYLRQMLDKHGGGQDYERAIARYGTFSTGHGREADEAVRGQYRAFMQGAARGGIVGRADGGDMPAGITGDLPDDGNGSTWDDPGGQGIVGPPPPPPGSTGYARALGPDATEVPLTAGPPRNSGAGPAAEETPDNPKVSPWRTLLNVGLGIMGGTSPQAGVNIGKGALTGLALSDKEQNTLETASLRRDQAKTNAMWRAAQSGLAKARADIIPVTEERRGAQGDRNLDIKENVANARGEYLTWKQGHGDATLEEQQAKNAALQAKWGVDQDLKVLAISQRGTAADQRATAASDRNETTRRGQDLNATSRAEANAIRREALAGARDDRERAAIARAPVDQLRLANGVVANSKNASGVATKTLTQALGEVTRNIPSTTPPPPRPVSRPVAAPVVTPAPTPPVTAPAAPGMIRYDANGDRIP